ncbi:hypothetical protein SDC9_154623 [bioreactor metagenome]|uniref:Uncharacterized protein n=1 Tax=bioreactor metagenome TaxID=1076179 RepID=A0A645EZJ3_9ZZZZ|nr:hypothetical protein [Paludibacter sp.]
MKKTILLLTTFLLINFISSCGDDEIENVKKDWIFTVTTVVSVQPEMEGYPMTVVQTVEMDEVTEAEANKYIKDNSGTATVAMGEMTMTTTITITKEEKP